MADTKTDLTNVLNKISRIVSDSSAEAPQNALPRFIDMLIEEKKFPDLTPEVKVEVKRSLLRKLDDFLAAKIISSLTDADIDVFEKMLKENKSPEELQKFTAAHIPNFTDFLTNALLEFRGVYLGLMHVSAFVDVDFKKTDENMSNPKQTGSSGLKFQESSTAPVMPQSALAGDKVVN